jgi:hypothetical protein
LLRRLGLRLAVFMRSACPLGLLGLVGVRVVRVLAFGPAMVRAFALVFAVFVFVLVLVRRMLLRFVLVVLRLLSFALRPCVLMFTL